MERCQHFRKCRGRIHLLHSPRRDLVAFAHGPIRPIVLPCTLDGQFRILSSYSEALAMGKTGVANWLTEVERLWEDTATEKSKKQGPYAWLNYRRKLTNQDPRSPY